MQFFSKLFFGEQNNLKEENEKLEKEIKRLEIELKSKEEFIKSSSALKEKNIQQDKYSKQWELMEKNLENLKSESINLKEIISYLNKIIPENQWNYSYKIRLEEFYTASKYEELVKVLNELNIFYVDELDKKIFSQQLSNLKSAEDGLQKYLKFKNGIYDWEIKTLLLKGEKISKVYNKMRKFLTLASNYDMEYIADLKEFNFNILLNYGFSQEDIELLIEKYKGCI